MVCRPEIGVLHTPTENAKNWKLSLFPLRNSLVHSVRLTGPALLLLLAAACKTSAPVATTAPPPVPAKPAVLTLGGTKAFSSDEFFDSFTKNQLSADSSQRTDIRGYLDLYTNLKLKVLAAEKQGRDTTEAFREEMATYRKQLAQSYLTDKTLVDQLTAEAYQRMQQEVNASHILIGVAEDAEPADTLAAYQQALSVRERLQNGESFEALARQVSKDPSAKQNSGNLGYFTAFQTVYPLETAAYTQSPGTLSTPIRTRFGYHILRVNDRRPSRGKVQVAHILVRLSPTAEPQGAAAAKTRIDEAYAKLQAGESFETVARTYSDDTQSKGAGGKLPAFATGQNVPAFEEAAFALTTPGSYSTPFKTNYGWHIVKLIGRQPMESFTELAPAIRQKVVTDSRADVLRQATLARLSREYKVIENEPVKDAALAKGDSSLFMGKWRAGKFLDDPFTTQPLLTIDNQAIPARKFFDYVEQKQSARMEPSGPPRGLMRRFYNRFKGDQLIAAEEANLDRKYPEFRALLNEVRDGVLLSQVMEEQVWERSMADSLGQKDFYEKNRAKYQYPERAVATIIDAADEKLLAEAKARLATSPYTLKRSAPGLQFSSNQTTLSTEGDEVLYEVMVTMVKNPAYVVEVTASRDASESDTVSTARLRRVVNYLTKNGVQLARITEKDVQAFRPNANGAAARRVTFTYGSTSKQDVARVLSSQQPNAVVITEGIFAKGQNKLVDELPWQKGTSTFTANNRVVQVTISRIDAPRPRTFAEARGAVINDYQAFLEQQFIANLRQKYPVQVNEDELKRLVK
ncbi:peptidyl-prolyl cis-trans isomerase SurA [Fibrella aestuarina BUZ 2]|uniref:Peptidyl-prolyl cis-trans isomerase SurA n=1 Tax=Fibrella aestuarina BUZ 2 TaxID=1166018 RepID=I0KC89_9BACT|nr:peptidyl-prolyl cis-trans isomerase SurA [Fibrella aestuarina BUZ 2]